ncbi:hypothetical protein FRC01_001793 [Tulasnella sp. 417]|nr:hypothetical protein FRC01_001793 [Tulasnella sp. 417]
MTRRRRSTPRVFWEDTFAKRPTCPPDNKCGLSYYYRYVTDAAGNALMNNLSSPRDIRLAWTAANLGEVKGATSSNQLPAQSGGWSILPASSDGSFGGDDGSTAAWDMTPAQRSVAERLRQEWEVYVIKDDKTPNAFVTGGGKIFVFTGIVPVAGNDDGLATVIGHEIAHQVQRHSAEKLSGAKVFGALVILLEILGLDVGISRLGLTLLMSLPNSRAMESEGK